MARCQIQDIDHVTALSSTEVMAVYGGFKLDWKGLLKGIFNAVPINWAKNVGGFDLGFQADGQGVRFGGQKGGFNFGFGLNW